MKRSYIHRYKVLSGPAAGTVSDGIEIGFQDYPDQFEKEGWSLEKISALAKSGSKPVGIWLNELGARIERIKYRDVTITDEGVNYSNNYLDLCVPFDRYGSEIAVGDTLMIASKNEVRRVKVTAISKKPYMASYGIVQRKLTVRDEVEGQTLTVSDARATIKV